MTGSRKPLKFWSLTVACNHAPLPTVARMKEILTEFAKQWCFQQEQGLHAGKHHYQVRLILEEPQMTETLLTVFECRSMDRKDLTFAPESNKSLEQGGLSFYVMKDESKVDGPWYDPTYSPKRKHVYEGKDLEQIKTARYPFQQYIISMLEEEPDDRTMVWWYNRSGCGGKSKLMKYLRVTTNSCARIGLGSATQVKTSVIEKGAYRTYMVDLPRVRGSDERQQELFSALEEIKNGWVESPMYGKHSELLMEPPHIHIFSNELPNLSYASMDRWRIYEIFDDSDGIQQFSRLTLEQVIHMQLPKD